MGVVGAVRDERVSRVRGVRGAEIAVVRPAMVAVLWRCTRRRMDFILSLHQK
jgi:hypothetical protein